MNESNAQIRVMLVDDHNLLRRGIAILLETAPDMILIGEASNGAEAITMCAQVNPDVVLMDLLMPQMDGVTAIRMIHEQCPGIAILVLTSFTDNSLVYTALQAGAIGYLLKTASGEEITSAIRTAYKGKPVLSPEVTAVLMKAFTTNAPSAPEHAFNLSDRELEVLSLMAKGLTNREIATNLKLSYSTVRFHVSSVLSKLGVSNRVEAITLAMQHNLIK